MKTGDQITLGMLSDFEFSSEATAKFNALAALEALDGGMSPDDAMLIFGLSPEQLRPYKVSWERQNSMMYA